MKDSLRGPLQFKIGRDTVTIKKDRRGAWRWKRVARNGETISSGEGYTRRYSARVGALRAAGVR